MRFYTVVQREGTRVGDVDWDYDFLSHFDCVCSPDEVKRDLCSRSVTALREAEAAVKRDETVEVCMSGGYWKRLLNVGMYDGWPYWKPVPSLFVVGVFGGHWESFNSVTAVRSAKC